MNKKTDIIVSISLLTSSIVRAYINKKEGCFHKIIKDYKLTDKEVSESIQALNYMGYSVKL
jgi:predicted transcriptional regulator